MDTQTQIDRLIELAIIQRSELKQLVEQLPQLREHLNAEVEKVFDETEPQLRAELEEWTTKQTADKTAALGVALEAKIADLAKSLEISTQARYNAIIAEREQNARLAAEAEAKIAEHAASLPSAVKDIVTAELARFPRAGEIDQLRKEFAEPRGLNPRGKWQAGETYNKLDLVTINGDSYTSNTDGNRTRPSRSSADWTLVAARGTGGGGGPTSLTDLTTVPSDGDLLIGSGTSWVTSNLTAGAGISITVGPGAITISATDGDITLDDGTAASPSLHFTNDPDTGIYRPAANTLGISVSGTQVAYFDENGLTVPSAGVVAGGSIHAGNGNANNPSLSFDGDQDTGFFRHQPNEIGVALGGTQKATLTSTTFSITPNLVVSGTGTINGTSIPASKTLVVTTDKLSALASTSSSELAGVISDETGTGALVFANTPTLVTPVIGAATGTSLTVTGNVTASDAILGSSGPSVKSTLSARAPRQGLVFDGTAVTTSWAGNVLGTGDFTASAWIYIREQPAASQIKDIFSSTGGSAFALRVNTYGGFFFDVASTYSAGTNLIAATPYIGKWAHVVYSRSYSGTTTFYVNGVSAATRSPNDTTNYSGTTNTIGTNAFPGTIAGPLLYNRALSASEVVALYESGAPAGADYNSASNTALNTTTFSNSSVVPFTTFSGASATGFTASQTSVANARANMTGSTFNTQVGQQFILYYDLTLNSGTGPVAYLGIENVVQTANSVQLTAGTGKSVTLTAVSATSGAYLQIGVFNNASTTNFAISNVKLVRAGLLLAPDAAQAGGGLTWYDTSGNAANITLPASGVSWNVPSSRVLGGNWTTSGNHVVSGGSIGVGGAVGSYFDILQGGNDAYAYNRRAGQLIFGTNNTTVMQFASNGNCLLKSDGIDGGQKLQVGGNALISGGSLAIGAFASLTAATATFYSQNSGGGNRSWSIGTSALAGADNQYGLVIRDVTGGVNALQLAYDTGNATFAGSAGIGGAPSGTYGKLSVHGGLRTVNDTNSKLEIGRYSSGVQNSYIKIGSSSSSLRVTNAADSVDLLTLTDGASGGNLGFNTPDQFGSGVGVFSIKNAVTVPSTNPTACGILYVEAGALKYRGSSGTVTTIANA